MQSIQQLLRYRAHNIFGQPSWKMAGAKPKKYVMSVKKKSSVNFLVRAKFLIRPRWNSIGMLNNTYQPVPTYC